MRWTTGGLQGGVAILCPGPARVEARRELVPGCAVEATITGLPGVPAVTYVSLYLPPGRQAEVITELDRIHPPAAPFVIGGDVNLDLDDPRDLEEERNGQALRALLQRWGARIVGGGQPTHQDRHGARRIDFLAVELHAAAAWDTTCHWHSRLSIHVVFHGRCQPGGPAALGPAT